MKHTFIKLNDDKAKFMWGSIIVCTYNCQYSDVLLLLTVMAQGSSLTEYSFILHF